MPVARPRVAKQPYENNGLEIPTGPEVAIENIGEIVSSSNRDMQPHVIPAGEVREYEAGLWYALNEQTCARPVVPELRRRFGLSVLQVVSALNWARCIRANMRETAGAR